jgi:BTB/POZ domain-containing protein KCTD9
MSDDLDRYRQDAKAFRKQIRIWIHENSRDGALGQLIQQQQLRQRKWLGRKLIRPVISALAGTRDRRRFLVVFLITLMGVIIETSAKKENSIQNGNFTKNTVTKISHIIFESLESISLASAGTIYLIETRERRKKDSNELWQIIHSARGQVVSGARKEALEDLNKDGADFKRIDLSKADLSHINLNFAKLEEVDLEDANLGEANLEGANLEIANLRGVQLGQANLQKAYLRRTDLRKAKLFQTKFQGADLGGANLQEVQGEMAYLQSVNLRGAYLQGANFQQAYLRNSFLAQAHLQRANLSWANLQNANLSQADLKETQLSGADLTRANLEGAKNVTETQLTYAKLCLTRLPDGIELKSNRDCQELGIDPETDDLLGNESDKQLE